MKKMVLRIFIPALLVFLAWQVFWGRSGLIQQYQITRQNQAIQSRIDSLRQVLEDKRREVDLLQSDSTYLEYLARTRLGMSRNDESVFLFVDDSLLQSDTETNSKK